MGYITEVAERCPEMREFRIKTLRFDSWPLLSRPWSSLVKLWLEHIEVASADGSQALGAEHFLQPPQLCDGILSLSIT